MGMDVYGLDPKRNTATPTAITDFLDENGWVDWKKLERNDTVDEEGETVMSKEHEAYWKAKDEWDNSNPGTYFRNNVWWWRPLWDYVCFACDDILDEEDADAGHSNSGHQISEKKAEVIAAKLKVLIKNGEVDYFATERQKALDDIPDEECEFCNGTGVRKDMKIDNGCNGCQGKGSRRPFNTQYPFDVDNVKEFAKFCEQSGGFEIC